MADNTGFLGVPGAYQNTIEGENNAQYALSHPGPTFTGSLSPSLAAQYQPPQAQNSFSVPYRPSFLNMDTNISQSHGFTNNTSYMQQPSNMQSHQLQELNNTSMPPDSSPYGGMYPSGSAFGAAQARGMPGQMANPQQQQQMPSMHRNMAGGASLTTHQRPMAQAYSPSARMQQLQSPLRTPSANAVRTSDQAMSTPRMPPSFEQQLAALARASSDTSNIITPPRSGRSASSSPMINNQFDLRQQNLRRSAIPVRAPQTTAPVQPTQKNMMSGSMRGQKRPANDASQAPAQAAKVRIGTDAHGDQIVLYTNPVTGQQGQVSLKQFQKWQAQKKKQMAAARKAEQTKNELARMKALADEEEKKKQAAAKAKVEQAEKARLAAIAAKAAKEKEEQERQARAKEQQRIEQERKIEAEKQKRLAAEQKRLAAEQKAWAEEQARQAFIAQEARRENERKLLRKEQLRKDPSALYRHYREYLSFFPVTGGGERTNPYLFKLLANRSMPSDETEELALAIQYAKDHWQLYLEFPRDVKNASKWQKEVLANRAADQQPTTSAAASANSKQQPSKR